MKKSLIIALVAATLGLAGCQKEDASSPSDMQSTSTTTTTSTPVATQPAAPAEQPAASDSK